MRLLHEWVVNRNIRIGQNQYKKTTFAHAGKTKKVAFARLHETNSVPFKAGGSNDLNKAPNAGIVQRLKN